MIRYSLIVITPNIACNKVFNFISFTASETPNFTRIREFCQISSPYFEILRVGIYGVYFMSVYIWKIFLPGKIFIFSYTCFYKNILNGARLQVLAVNTHFFIRKET